MKYLPLSLLLCGGLAACTAGPAHENPVVVTGNNVAIHAEDSPTSKVIAVADKGDTLELQGVGAAMYAVSPDAQYHRFKDGIKAGYIARQFATVSASSLAKAKAGQLHPLPKAPEEKPEHLNGSR